MFPTQLVAMCLSQLPLGTGGDWNSSRGESFQHLGVEEGWVCPSRRHYQIYSLVLRPIFYWLYQWHLPSTCFSSLSWFSNYLEPQWEKGCWSSVWPSRKFLCFAFSLKMAAELLCKSHLSSVPWLRPQGEHYLQAGLCVVSLQAGSPASQLQQPVFPRTLMSMFLLPSPPSRSGCLRRQEPSLWSLGNPATELTDSFGPRSQLGGFSPWKSFSAELHAILHPGLNSWTVHNTLPLFSAWILLTVNLLKAQESFWGYFTWKQ